MMDTTLKVEDLHKKFGAVEVLKGVSLEARTGDVIVMIGSSGSGKSTLLRCINLLETPNSGRVYVNGELIRMKPLHDGTAKPEDMKQVERIRSELAMVFQSFNLWTHRTILENVIEAPIHVLGLPRKEAIERAEILLAKVGIAEKRNFYPIICLVDNNNARRSHEHWRWSQVFCYLMSRPRHSIPNLLARFYK